MSCPGRSVETDETAGIERVVLVTDNPNTHTPACLFEVFESARARAIAEELVWHSTPRHGSWLNVTEVE